MKTIWLILTLIFTLYAGETAANNDPFKNVTYFKLENGMQVYMLADPKAEKTGIRLTVGVGYDNETEKNYGISHLVEHLVFRDRRVPHHDYLDYFREEGATDINGFTRRYETGYVATVPAEKSYWAIKTFSQMLFDKNVTQEDLEAERKALQTEIGEPHWYYHPLSVLKHFFESVTPPQEDFYLEQFGLPKAKELPDRYHAQENNKRFTLDEVTARYKAYYYPANMKLMVVGDFDARKMRQLITESFGKVKKRSGSRVVEPHYSPVLNSKPYMRFYEGAPKNYAYIGAKYVLDDYKKFLILDIYTEALAQRLQQKLRNRDGKTYTVSETGFSDKHAGAALIGFDGLVDVFSENIAEAEKMIASDRKKMTPASIRKAMAWYEKTYYSDIEHDSGTLMDMVDMADYLRKEHNITDRTSYAIFKSITPEEFQQTVTETFRPENRYRFVTREYYFFPMEMGLLSLLGLLLFIGIYLFFGRWQLRRMGLVYTQRDIVFQRRLSSRFAGFVVFVLTSLVASISFEWIKYLFSRWVMGDPRWMMTIDVPYGYLLTLFDTFGYLVWFFILYFYLWRYYARLHVLDDKIVLIGNRVAVIEKSRIEQVDVVPWRRRRKGAVTFGTAWRFWRPLVALHCREGEVCYLRAGNAAYLKEDLEKWLDFSFQRKLV